MQAIRFARRALASAALGLALGVQAQTGTPQPVVVAGIDFAPSTSIANQAVVLNGAGTSNIMSTRATAVGLYLPSKTQQVDQALAMPGPKRITMVALRDLSSRDLSNALLDRIRQNAAPGEVEANVLQIAAVGGVFGTRARMNKGEVLTIDWLPASKSTEFRMNGETMGTAIAGDKFYPLMMKIWVGPRVRGATRDALLGTGSSS
jgi:hypothetical protein